jgi:hypothetical protein
MNHDEVIGWGKRRGHTLPHMHYGVRCLPMASWRNWLESNCYLGRERWVMPIAGSNSEIAYINMIDI